MITLNDILHADSDDTLGTIKGVEYRAISIVIADDGMQPWVWGFLFNWFDSHPAAILTLQQQIDQLTQERDAARKVVEVLTSKPPAPDIAKWDGDQRFDRADCPPWNQAALINQRVCDQNRRCAEDGSQTTGPWPCACSQCVDRREAYRVMDRLKSAPASPIAFANGATLTPEQEQDLRRAVADLKQTNSHAVPLAPLLTRICRCEDCEAHRRVLAEGGSITGAPTLPPEIDPKKVCPCDDCQELRKYLSARDIDGWQLAECEGH